MYICSTNNKALENMNKKDKELLLKDLCARLPYGVKCAVFDEKAMNNVYLTKTRD